MNNKEKYIAVICVFIFCSVTLVKSLTHTPWFDEAHAWTIAEQLNLLQVFNYVKDEGHFFLWQFILYPFAKLHLYPYALQIINWFFCSVAIIILWKKAPFHWSVKSLITFSAPIFLCYSIIARCYSVGILLLFMLSALFKDKLKYPKTYALLLILCANSSLLALFGAIPLGLIFLYEIIKKSNLQKKDLFITYSILLAGAVLILYQILNIGQWETTVAHRTLHISVKIFRSVFVQDRLAVNLLLLSVFAVPILMYFKQNKNALFFISMSYFFFLALAMGVYGCFFWHTYFFYILLVVAFWICDNGEIRTDLRRNAYISFALITILLILNPPELSKYQYIYNSNTLSLLKFIEQDEILSKANFLQNGGNYYELVPYLHNKSFKMRNYCSLKENSDYNLLNISDNKYCANENAMWQAKLHPEMLKNLVDNNTYTFILNRTLETKGDLVEMKQDGYSILFKKYKNFDLHSFWKIEIK